MSGKTFMFRVHHSGKFVWDGRRLHYGCGGKSREFLKNRDDIDKLSEWNIKAEIHRVLGFEEHEYLLWYNTNGKPLEDGRRYVYDRNSLHAMYCEAINEGEVDVFIDHVEEELPEQVVLSQVPSQPIASDEEDLGNRVEVGNEADEDQPGSSESSKYGNENGDRESDSEFEADEEEKYDDEVAANNVHDDAEKRADSRYGTIHMEEQVGIDEVCNAIQEKDEDAYVSETYPDTDTDSDSKWRHFRKEKKKFPYVAPDGKNANLALFQVFMHRQQVKDAIFKYALNNRYDIKYDRSSTSKLSAKCSYPGCPWRIYVSIDPSINKWMVKQILHEHKCKRRESISLLNYIRLADMFEEKIRERSDYPAGEMKNDVMRLFNLQVTKEQCRRARKLALDRIRGSYKEHFGKIWDYAAEISNSNPGARVDIVTTTCADSGQERFCRIFIGFPALAKGWNEGCRRVLGIDGCFLKWLAKGELLSAVGRDANNQIYPVAWAVVDVECKDSWDWFLDNLKEHLGLSSGVGLTIISDQQKGLLAAVEKQLSDVEHRMCARHIYANWRKKHKEDLMKPLFWDAARSYTVQEFNNKVEAIKNRSINAFDDLMRTSPEHWCRAYFNVQTRCDDISNNMSESFNNTLRFARTKPIISLLEDLRKMTMKRMAERKKQSSKEKKIVTPRARAVLDNNREKAFDCRVWSGNPGIYEVEIEGKSKRVDVSHRSCSCKQWDLSGIPCCHAVAAILELNDEPEKFVHDYHCTTYWRQAYETMMEPVNSEDLWVKTGKDPLGPPKDRVMPGRPKRNRRKDPHESPTKPGIVSKHGRIITRSKCHKSGHNKLSCSLRYSDALPTPQVEHKPRGRPKTKEVKRAQPPKVAQKRQERYQVEKTQLPEIAQERQERQVPLITQADQLGIGQKRSRGRPRKNTDSGTASGSHPKRQRKPKGHGVLVTKSGQMIQEDYGAGTSRCIG